MKEQKRSRFLNFIWWIFLCSSSMGIMLFFAAGKTITIENVPRDSEELSQMIDTYDGAENKGISLKLQEDPQETRICIPLENGLRADYVIMENRYIDKELWIYIQGKEQDFYKDQVITGKTQQVKAGYYEKVQDGVLLKFVMDEIYEYSSVMENNCLYIDKKRPGEVYQQIVVVDPGGESIGDEEWDITLRVAQSLKKELENTGIKVYLTGLENNHISGEQKAALANELHADMFIGISCSEDADETKYGTLSLYNDSYFIPGFGNIELADLLVKNVVTEVSGRAVGLEAADPDSILSKVKVTAAVIRVGYLSNPREGQLLRQPQYGELIAKGIAGAVLEAYEEYGQDE